MIPRLEPPDAPAAKRRTSDGAISDGPIGPQASGYSILRAGSLDAAVTLAQGCPVLQPGGQIPDLRDDRDVGAPRCLRQISCLFVYYGLHHR